MAKDNFHLKISVASERLLKKDTEKTACRFTLKAHKIRLQNLITRRGSKAVFKRHRLT